MAAEPFYVVTLSGSDAGVPVTFDTEVVAASNDEEARRKALDWAASAVGMIGQQVGMTLTKDGVGILTRIYGEHP